MTNQAILEKAVDKAIENGWEPLNGKEYTVGEGWVRFLTDPQEENGYETLRAEEIIYNHDFAKAIWPAGRCICGETHNRGGIIEIGPGKTTLHELEKDWQYHLQQMVISEDPIKYLGKSL